MFHSNCVPILHHFWDISRCWSKIANSMNWMNYANEPVTTPTPATHQCLPHATNVTSLCCHSMAALWAADDARRIIELFRNSELLWPKPFTKTIWKTWSAVPEDAAVANGPARRAALHVVLYTKVDVQPQRDRLTTFASLSHWASIYADNTCDVQLRHFLSPDFVTMFQREVPLFLRIFQLPSNTM